MSDKSSTSEPDRGVQAGVSSSDLPKLTVKVTDGTTLYVDGKLVKEGDTCELDFPAATNLVMLGHGEIVSSTKGASK